ncbi:MAG TPA: cellulose synthase family protein [Candidatus Dormibacteraeota bacterium]|nr:cellulose synthase family protein [Candidatus Dormibacteraeota bacterium]
MNWAVSLIALQAASPVWGYFHRQFDPTLNPFRGLYQANVFDLSMMLPYFIVLGILAVYGVHRYWLVYDYFKYRHNVPATPPEPADWPKVTIQLPIYNERYVIERLIDAAIGFDYPRDKLEIQVLDDSTDETQQITRAVVDRYRALGEPIFYLHRTNRVGFKAGALQEGLLQATGEFVAIFDADFLPPADFLRRTLPYLLADPKAGMVQTRWTYLNRHYSALTEVEGILLDGHFVVEHGARSRRGIFFNFNGTAGVWRRATIDDAGGWEHDTLTEDTDLSYRAQIRGWRFVYVPQIECPSELPVEMTAFKTQQARWAKGLMQTAKKTLPRVFDSKVSGRHKVEAFLHLTANISYPLMVALSVILLPAMIVRFYQGWFQMLLLDLPLFLAATCSISGFYLVSQREIDPKNWKRSILLLPFVMAVGIGLSVRNARAVLEALFGMKSDFARTPKYRIEGKQKMAARPKAYRRGPGWTPFIELALGVYFIGTIAYAIRYGNYATIPFLILFVWGYLYTGIMSLGQPYFERFRSHSAAPTPSETRPAAASAPGF